MTQKQVHILYISPGSEVRNYPRLCMRATQLAAYYPITIFSFQRGPCSNSPYPPEIGYQSLGRLRSQNHHRRPFKLIAAVCKIRSFIKQHCYRFNFIYYAQSLDCLAIAQLSGIQHGFYEVADLVTTQRAGRALAPIEALLIRRSTGLVLTSSSFYDEYYKNRNIFPSEKVFVIENKVDRHFEGKRPKKAKQLSERIRIGLIGRFRYRRPIEYLLRFAKANPDRFVLECYGGGSALPFVQSYLCENIRYHGQFESPGDLMSIYDSVDISYVVYDVSSKNVRLALPTKLYESAFFRVPILCCEGTSLEKTVVEWGIGMSVPIASYEAFAYRMETIDHDWVEQCAEQCDVLTEDALLDDGKEVVGNMLRSFG